MDVPPPSTNNDLAKADNPRNATRAGGKAEVIECEADLGDLEEVRKRMDQAYAKVKERLVRPNVLLAGAAGSGKSELVNAMFGDGTARTGVGAPVTQDYSGYGRDDSKAVVIYDCKGLEHGSSRTFVEATTKFLNENTLHPDRPEQGIHCVWYIINLAETRVDDYTFNLWNTVYKDQHIICVLNKADLVSDDVAEAMRERILSQDCPALKRVVVTVAKLSVEVKNQKQCPACGSKRVRQDMEFGTLFCKDCKVESNSRIQHGLTELVDATLDVLPDNHHKAFVMAQRLDLDRKDLAAYALIKEAVDSHTVYDIDVLCDLMASIGTLFGSDLVNTSQAMNAKVREAMTVNGLEKAMFIVFDKLYSFFGTTQNQIEICSTSVAAYKTYRTLIQRDFERKRDMKREPAPSEIDADVTSIFYQSFRTAVDVCADEGTDACLAASFPGVHVPKKAME